MDKDNLSSFVKFAPWIVIILGFCFQFSIFTTPADLENRLERFYTKIEQNYVTRIEFNRLQKQNDDITVKIDKIYDYIISKK